MIRKLCKGCKRPFESNNRQIYCSPFCYPKKTKTKRICRICGKEFLGSTFECGMICYLIFRKQKQEQDRLKRKLQKQSLPRVPCLWCHELFSQVQGVLHVYCSNECGCHFRQVQHQIYKMGFEKNVEIEEIEKLRKLGRNYVLPERDL